MKTLEELRAIKDAYVRELNAAIDALEAAESPEDVEARQADFDAAAEKVERAKAEIGRAERIAEARSANPMPTASEVRVTKNESVYRKDGSHSFYADLVHARSNREAADRLYAHAQEMRDLGWDVDASGADFVPPLFLINDYAGVPRPGRPFANAIGSRPLMDMGMTLSFPKLTTGASVAVQGSANAAVSETDAATETVTSNVVTIAGQQDMSIQLIERGGPGFDQIIFTDLMNAYDAELDRQLINGGGTAGQHLGIHNVTGLGTITANAATASLSDITNGIYSGISSVYSNRYMAPSLIVMHPRRAAWLAAQGATAVPVFQNGNLYSAYGAQDLGVVQTFSGIPVVIDANVSTTTSTNQDTVYVVYGADMLLFESTIRTRVFDSPLSGNLGVRLQVFGYSAFSANRQPKAIARLGGTALATTL